MRGSYHLAYSSSSWSPGGAVEKTRGEALRRRPRPVPGRLRRWWLDRSVRVKGMIVVAVPLIALVGVTSAILVLQ